MHAPKLDCMSTLQVRDVPEEVRRVLKARAATAGQSLSDYVLNELKRVAQRPTFDELAERIDARGRVNPERSAADVLSEARAERP